MVSSLFSWTPRGVAVFVLLTSLGHHHLTSGFVARGRSAARSSTRLSGTDDAASPVPKAWRPVGLPRLKGEDFRKLAEGSTVQAQVSLTSKCLSFWSNPSAHVEPPRGRGERFCGAGRERDARCCMVIILLDCRRRFSHTYFSASFLRSLLTDYGRYDQIIGTVRRATLKAGSTKHCARATFVLSKFLIEVRFIACRQCPPTVLILVD